MMILQIALGIVLSFIILINLDSILTLLAKVSGSVIILAILILGILIINSHPIFLIPLLIFTVYWGLYSRAKKAGVTIPFLLGTTVKELRRFKWNFFKPSE